MAFILTELVIESMIREGLENLRRDPSIVDDVFENLVSLPIYKKYGEKELNKIKDLVTKKEISVVHGFPVADSKMPCISIQLMSAQENEKRSAMDDYWKQAETPMSQEELDEQVKETNILILGYDSNTGVISIDDSADLSNVHANQLFVDVDGNEFKILGGVRDDAGHKQVIIQKDAEINTVGPALVKSMFNTNSYEVRTNVERETILLGVHTKEALQTKYTYTLLKYIVESRKLDLIRRGFQLATYEGSDFSQNQEYQSDYIFSRYLTVSGLIENTWNADKIIPIDLIDVAIKVEKDEAGNEALGLTNQTIQVQEEDE